MLTLSPRKLCCSLVLLALWREPTLQVCSVIDSQHLTNVTDWWRKCAENLLLTLGWIPVHWHSLTLKHETQNKWKTQLQWAQTSADHVCCDLHLAWFHIKHLTPCSKPHCCTVNLTFPPIQPQWGPLSPRGPTSTITSLTETACVSLKQKYFLKKREINLSKRQLRPMSTREELQAEHVAQITQQLRSRGSGSGVGLWRAGGGAQEFRSRCVLLVCRQVHKQPLYYVRLNMIVFKVIF